MSTVHRPSKIIWALPLAALAAAWGCTSSDGGPTGDAAPAEDALVIPDGAPPGDGPAPDRGPPPPDAGPGDLATDGAPPPPDAPQLPVVLEQEPNDGATLSELNDVTVPTVIEGTIGATDDTDIFRFAAAAGDRLLVSIEASGDLQPHLAVFGEPPLDVPVLVNRGPGDLMIEVYVLTAGNYLLGVRDRRNVGSSSAGVGGPAFGYTITVTPLTRQPVALPPGKLASALDPPGTVRVFSFDAKAGDEVTLEIFAARLAPPSDVDSRLSLFHPGKGEWLGTNDNPGLTDLDALLHAASLPFDGPYHAIVDNVAETGSSFDFEIELTKN